MRHWRRHLITALVLLVITLLLGPMGLGKWLWSTPRHLSEPIMISESSVDGKIDTELLKLNERALLLQKEVADLQARLLAIQQAKGFEDSGQMEVLVYDARVVSRTRGQREQYVEINRGALDKVTRGMAVCAGKSILGLVTGEDRHKSLVRLISDPQSRIAAHVYDGKSRIAGGVLSGASRSGLCEVLYVEDRPGLVIKAGQYAVTAGTDGIVPEGLIMGVITNAERSKTSDSWHIVVEPLRPVHAVTEVIVCRRASRPPKKAAPPIEVKKP